MEDLIANAVVENIDYLWEIVSRLSPSSEEEGLSDYLAEFFNELGLEAQWDRVGNLVCWEGKMENKPFLIAHMDNVAFMIVKDEGGSFKLSPVGGPLPLEITEALCLTEKKVIEGIIYKENDNKYKFHILEDDEYEEVEEGDLVAYYPYLKVTGEKIVGTFLDDKINIFAMMVLAKLWRKHYKKEFPYVLAFTVREEWRGRGSQVLPQNLPELEEAIILDVVYGNSPYSQAEVEIGEGTGICFKDAYGGDRDELKKLVSLAKEKGIPYQLEIVNAGGSDLANIYWQNGGIKVAYAGVPVANCHTPREVASLKDVIALVNLLWEKAKLKEKK